MKSWKGILLALLILASFAGCSRSATSTPEDSAAESQSAQAETSTEAESTETEQPEAEPLPTFTFGGVEFYPILLSEDTLTSLDTTEGTLPGERSETVSEIKAALFATYGDSELQFVSHTQARPEVLDYYDTHLQTLVETLYTFCQLEPQTSMSEQTVYLLDLLPTLPEEMQQDIYTAYKAQMIEAGIDGSLLRDGSDLGLYYVAQTDPDWRDYPFPNAASPNEVDDTAYDRACGVMSMTMVGSTYLHRELDPTDLIDYVQENGYRITASGVDDTFMTVAADLFGIVEPEIYYTDPTEGQQEVDWDYILDAIQNDNATAIVHETAGTANFTPAQHYMVINGYVEQNGTGYYLVSDPYQSRRYAEWGTASMGDPGLNEEGVILATPELMARDASAVILFPADQDAWELVCHSTEPVTIEGASAE